ncbi:hypothetical protein QYE76_058817 [Lolium multiflorum]|uniref:F-box domain-containing protein n=1 Tax=Lolium multiflorum TaxID=4521 RepID=A0AAD8WRY6_LOLMU|nr:hypothetical protein QYE76_058817 [Lolium multiflorum]
MENERAAAKRKRTRTSKKPHVPHEVVTEILLRLPTRSLLRFTSVCKAWRATIFDDPAFDRDLRLRRRDNPCLLIATQTRLPNHNMRTSWQSHVVATTGLYRWQGTEGAATLMQAMESLPAEPVRRFAHCDGLVLVASDSTVRVLNPATRRVLTLPVWSTSPSSSHPSFGLGCDPWTNAYKVARLWQRTEPKSKSFTGIVYTYHVEVFTIRADQHWRKLVHPPHSIMIGQTATFFKGSLLWIIQPYEPTAVSGFLRLKLWDETFTLVSWPPCGPWFHNEACLSELCGELCVTCPDQNLEMLDMWMCKDVDGADLPRWDKRYTIRWDWARASLRPLAILGDGVLMCQTSRNMLCCCNLHTDDKHVEVKDTVRLNDLEYLNPEDGTILDYACKIKFSFDVISYVPSLARI